MIIGGTWLLFRIVLALLIFLYFSIPSFAQTTYPNTANGATFGLTRQLYQVKCVADCQVTAKGRYYAGDGNGNAFVWCDTCLSFAPDSTKFLHNSDWAAGQGWYPLYSASFFSNTTYTSTIYSKISDSLQYYNAAGKVRAVQRVWRDTVVGSGSSPFTINIATAGFSQITGVYAQVSYNSSSIASIPIVSVKEATTGYISLNVLNSNQSLISGLGTVATGLTQQLNLSGVKFYLTVTGY